MNVIEDALSELREATARYESADRAHNAAIRRYKVAYCEQHGLEEGKNIMLTNYQRCDGAPRERRKAVITRFHVNKFSVVISVVPYTKDGERGARRMGCTVIDGEWEHI